MKAYFQAHFLIFMLFYITVIFRAFMVLCTENVLFKNISLEKYCKLVMQILQNFNENVYFRLSI